MGIKRGLKINEYGVFKGRTRVAGRTEEEVFASVGLPYVEPELRESRGEIEAAGRGALPRLVGIEDIRGDLHAHSVATDGRDTIEEMAAAAEELGYAYLAITDHTRSLRVARGQDPKRVLAQVREIDRLNARLKGIRILKAAEVDILENGGLDLPDSVLEELDLTVCSVHSRFELSRERQTERILRAMDNRHLKILGHPTGRLIGRRKPYEIDLERVIEGAVERGCALEMNAQPERMDLGDIYVRHAAEKGALIAINSDAHGAHDLGYMRFGVAQARRAWVEPGSVLNTRALARLLKVLRR